MLKKILSVISIIYFSFIVFSCTVQQSLNTVDIDFKTYSHELSTTTMFDTTKYVRLQCSDEESFISHIDRILFCDNRIAILDRGLNKIALFDSIGGFLHSTVPFIGKAQNEYIQITDACIDNANEEIYVSCDVPKQIMVFDRNLKLKRTLKTNSLIKEIAVDDTHLYAIRLDEKTGSKLELIVCNKDTIGDDFKTLLEQETIAGIGTLGKSLTNNGAITLVCMPFDNVIHKLRQGSIVESFGINIKDEWFEREKCKDLRGRAFFDAIGDRSYCIVNLYLLGTKLLFNTNNFNTYMADISNREGGVYTNLINDKTDINKTVLTSYGGKEQIVVRNIEPITIMQYKDFSKQEKKESKSAFDLYIQDMTEDSNPIIEINTIIQSDRHHNKANGRSK